MAAWFLSTSGLHGLLQERSLWSLAVFVHGLTDPALLENNPENGRRPLKWPIDRTYQSLLAAIWDKGVFGINACLMTHVFHLMAVKGLIDMYKVVAWVALILSPPKKEMRSSNSHIPREVSNHRVPAWKGWRFLLLAPLAQLFTPCSLLSGKDGAACLQAACWFLKNQH